MLKIAFLKGCLLQVTEKGFMFAVPWRYKSLRLNEDVLDPNYLQANMQLRVMDFVQEEEFTQAPQYLLESELIALMDKHGIGQ